MAKHRTGYLFKRGSAWYVQWKVEGKVFSKALRDERGETITSKREAEEARARLMAPFAVAHEAEALETIAGKLEGRRAELAKFEDEMNPALTIAQAWGEFMTSPNRPDSGAETLYQYECQWKRFADWMQEKHRDVLTLRGVTKAIAEQYASTLNHGTMSPNSYNKHLNLLALVFRTVRGKAKLTENVWESPKRGGFLQRKRLITNSRRELTIEELRRVCQKATGELRTLLALGVYSGLRLGDCATLRWGEVDLTRATICRVPNKTSRRNPKPVLVPIHPVLSAMLAEIPAEKRTGYVLPDTAALYLRRIDAVTDLIQEHFKACGIQVHKPGTGPAEPKEGESKTNRGRAVLEVGFHSLRHTFVSLCRESNAPLSVVESIVGHSNPAMTRHYTHVGELAAAQAVAALPAIVGEDQQKGKSGVSDSGSLIARLRAVAEGITAKNWKASKAEMLTLINSAR